MTGPSIASKAARLGRMQVRVAIEPSREVAITKMKAAIAATCPEYCEAELTQRAGLWVAKALKSGAIIITGAAQ